MESNFSSSCFKFYFPIFYLFHRNPTPKNILGVHWDMAKQGEILEYLAVNTTENSTTLWNYRQRECAFWTDYLPTVIGYITPTYPPTTEVNRDPTRDGWIIKEFIKRKWSSELIWAVGAAENKPPNCHKYATFLGAFFQLFVGKIFLKS